MPGGQSGVFFHGMGQTQLPFGNGYLCINGGVVRGKVTSSGANHIAIYEYDNSDPQRSLAAHVGSTRHFQYWYRDAMGGGTLFNLSNAISIAILP